MSDTLALRGGKPAIREPLPTIKNATGRLFGEEEKRLVLEALESGSLSCLYGAMTGRFERRFAERMGVENSVAVCNGTSALHTAMIYLNPEPGDEVIVTPISDMGSVIPIVCQQAIPVFADVDPFDLNLDPRKIEELISPRTVAIMVVHFFGSPANMDGILAIAKKHNLFVIEDCAQAHMAEYHGNLVGTLGDVGCFSFQQSKHVTTGDGGMVISKKDNAHGRSLRLCSDKGWPRKLGGRDHYFLAPNYHITELQAAVGLAQIEKYATCIAGRRAAAQRLDDNLRGLEAVRPLGTHPNCKQTYFHYGLRIQRDKINVDGRQFAEALEAEGLECELGYPEINLSICIHRSVKK